MVLVSSLTATKTNWGETFTGNTKRTVEAVLSPLNHSTQIQVLNERAESGLFIDENEMAEKGDFFEMRNIKQQIFSTV